MSSAGSDCCSSAAGSSSTFRIATEAEGSRDMTEDEVSNLVQKALQKARQSKAPSDNGTGEKGNRQQAGPAIPNQTFEIDTSSVMMSSVGSDCGSSAAGSSSTFRIATEAEGEKDMTEDEVSNLVQNALRKARQSKAPSDNGTGETGKRQQAGPSIPNQTFEIDTSSVLVEELGGLLITAKNVNDNSPEIAVDSSGIDTDAILRRADEEIAKAKLASTEAEERLRNALASRSRSHSENGSTTIDINSSGSGENIEVSNALLSPSQEFAAVMGGVDINMKDMLTCSSDEEGDSDSNDMDLGGYKIDYADEIDKVISEEFKDASVTGSLELEEDVIVATYAEESVQTSRAVLEVQQEEDKSQEINNPNLTPSSAKSLIDDIQDNGYDSEPEPCVSMLESMAESMGFPDTDEQSFKSASLPKSWSSVADKLPDAEAPNTPTNKPFTEETSGEKALVGNTKVDTEGSATIDENIQNEKNNKTPSDGAGVIADSEAVPSSTNDTEGKVDKKGNNTTNESRNLSMDIDSFLATKTVNTAEIATVNSASLGKEPIDTIEAEGAKDEKTALDEELIDTMKTDPTEVETKELEEQPVVSTGAESTEDKNKELEEQPVKSMETEGIEDKEEDTKHPQKPALGDETGENSNDDEPEVPDDEKPENLKQDNASVSEEKKTEIGESDNSNQDAIQKDRYKYIFIPAQVNKLPVKQEKYESPGDLVTEESDRQITFKDPYPAPRPLAKPRPSEQIKRDNQIDSSARPVRWSMPKRELNELLMASRDVSLARRSNSCGALKVLTMKRKNRLALVRTEGFLDSIVSVAENEIPVFDRVTALDARLRAVTVLYQVSEEKDNREIICRHPGLNECLVKIIKEDDGEARVHACAALAMLAKTAANRDPLAHTKDLVNVLGKVLGGTCTEDVLVPVSASLIVAEELAQMDTQKSTEEEKKEQEERQGGEREEEEDDYVDVSSEDHSYASYSSSSFASSMQSMTTDGEESFSDRSSLASVGQGVANISNVTQRKDSSIRMEKDNRKDEFTVRSRSNACAALIHLSKHCTISDVLCAKKPMLKNLLTVCVEFTNPIHTKCIEIICNLTRFPANCYGLSRTSQLISTLVKCARSKIPHDRMWALRSLQNISSDSSSKIALATSKTLNTVSTCSMRSNYDEKLAAVSVLFNLSTDAGAVVPMTNTKNVVATLIHLAHKSESPSDIRQIACDALATIGLWLQTLAAEGKVPIGMKKVSLPSHASSGWDKWD